MNWYNLSPITFSIHPFLPEMSCVQLSLLCNLIHFACVEDCKVCISWVSLTRKPIIFMRSRGLITVAVYRSKDIIYTERIKLAVVQSLTMNWLHLWCIVLLNELNSMHLRNLSSAVKVILWEILNCSCGSDSTHGGILPVLTVPRPFCKMSYVRVLHGRIW